MYYDLWFTLGLLVFMFGIGPYIMTLIERLKASKKVEEKPRRFKIFTYVSNEEGKRTQIEFMPMIRH